jgi:hypothetical protein
MRGAPEITILDSAFWWEIDQAAHCCGRCEGLTPVAGCFKGCILGVIRLKCLSVEPVANTPEEFGAFMKSELAKYEKVVKASGARVD